MALKTPGHFTAREKTLVYIELGGCWSWSGYFGEDIALLLLPRFETNISLFGVLTMHLPRFKPQIFQRMS
jgi:hypothetical protein